MAQLRPSDYSKAKRIRDCSADIRDVLKSGNRQNSASLSNSHLAVALLSMVRPSPFQRQAGTRAQRVSGRPLRWAIFESVGGLSVFSVVL